MATCPECDADIDIDEGDAEEGDQVDCPECGERFVVSGTDPLELELADEDEDEDDDDDDDEAEEEDDFSDDDDLEDDEEEDEGDWEE